MQVWDKVKLKVNVNILQVFRHQIHMYVMLRLAYAHVGILSIEWNNQWFSLREVKE